MGIFLMLSSESQLTYEHTRSPRRSTTPIDAGETEAAVAGRLDSENRGLKSSPERGAFESAGGSAADAERRRCEPD